jgi:hypothetical protein
MGAVKEDSRLAADDYVGVRCSMGGELLPVSEDGMEGGICANLVVVKLPNKLDVHVSDVVPKALAGERREDEGGRG